MLAILALLTVTIRPLFWLFVVAFNLVGTVDLLDAYYNAIRGGLPALAGQLGAAYVIPIIYVPMLAITHVVAVYWLVRPRPKVAPEQPDQLGLSTGGWAVFRKLIIIFLEIHFMKEKNNV